mmetsp:Transcript_36514/g.96338  ORF Transcript_36514/g.96338 Transcript_36514/m.96338 type:complete len:179 (+) Transcript_36514:732-1268(+)
MGSATPLAAARPPRRSVPSRARSAHSILALARNAGCAGPHATDTSSSSSSSSSSVSGKGPSLHATRRTFVLERGPQGLGLELDQTNTIVNIKPGGRAERQGLVCVDDTVITIDGKSCAGKLMQDVMIPGRPVYVVEISRPEPGLAPAKPPTVVRRSLSFDRKSGQGIRRSFSFDRKKW